MVGLVKLYDFREHLTVSQQTSGKHDQQEKISWSLKTIHNYQIEVTGNNKWSYSVLSD